MAQDTISISERTIRVTIRFSPEEISKLDTERGSVKRSEYIRRCAIGWQGKRRLDISQTIARIKGKLTDINKDFSRLDWQQKFYSAEKAVSQHPELVEAVVPGFLPVQERGFLEPRE